MSTTISGYYDKTLYIEDRIGTVVVETSGTLVVPDGDGILMYQGTADIAGTLIAQTAIFFDGYGTFINTGLVIATSSTHNQINTAVELETTGNVLNSGTILASSGYKNIGVRVIGAFNGNGGTITNASSGLIAASAGYGIELANKNASVTNAGTVTGDDAGILSRYYRAVISNSGFVSGGNSTFTVANSVFSAAGVALDDGGKLNNLAGGTITGTNAAVFATEVNGQVASAISNSGVIEEFGTTPKAGVLVPAAAVVLLNGGKVTNGVGGSIIAAGEGIRLAGGLVENSGLISGNLGGLYFSANGSENYASISNRATGIINAQDGIGIQVTAEDGKVDNAGTVNAGVGVDLDFEVTTSFSNEGAVFGKIGAQIFGATVVDNAGSIFSSEAGIIAYSATSIDATAHKIFVTGSSSFALTDTIDGALTLAPAGIILLDGGSATNASGSLIDASAGNGIVLLDGGTVTNAGQVLAKLDGVLASGATSIENSSTISGHVGVVAGAGATLTNSGTILGKSGVAVEFTGTNDRLILAPHGVFGGLVEDSGSGGVLELGSGTSTGTIAAFNTQYSGFSTIDIDSGASWKIAGNIVTLLNDGTLAITSGTSLDITGDIDANSTGVFLLSGNASLDVAAALGTNVKIQFLSAVHGGTLAVENAASFGVNIGAANYAGPLLEDFKAGDVIDFKNLASSGLTLSYDAGTGNLLITASGGGVVASLQFQNSSLGAGSFSTTADSGHGTLLTLG